jgi:hypothetical protein
MLPLLLRPLGRGRWFETGIVAVDNCDREVEKHTQSFASDQVRDSGEEGVLVIVRTEVVSTTLLPGYRSLDASPSVMGFVKCFHSCFGIRQTSWCLLQRCFGYYGDCEKIDLLVFNSILRRNGGRGYAQQL